MLKRLMVHLRNKQSIQILTTAVVEVMRRTVYIRTERARKNKSAQHKRHGENDVTSLRI